jgi:quercetin dioxygenase-like cupin family protein
MVYDATMTIHVGPNDGTPLKGGGCVRIKGSQTGGALAVVEVVLRPKHLIAQHVHANDVWVYVLSGEVGVQVGDERATAGPGSWLLKPRNIPHAIWNATSEPARILELLTPAGSEDFYVEAQAVNSPEDFAAVCARHGLVFFPESPVNAELRKLLEV